ncbi:hypothetical protein QP415_10505 [Pauljensenia sp. UMB3104]|jgi:hypothetical protein|uniref:helix-turn-helix domain-containing protein n=1 Tax=Pauljensenia sp. UMB3104 TaxID=3046331 RepID=UPI00254B5362|nr:hypothetical protein [Pauljensenia sp. UMB3104]MDK7160279.1 hypothetical protein [Pauljensenia sp. UMB3104]
MEPTITITDEMGAGGIVTVTPEGVQDVLTSWFAEAYADDPQIEACVDTVVAWAEAGRHAIDVHGMVEAEAYLGINITKDEPKPPREPNFRGVLSPDLVERITRDSLEAALTATGSIIGTDVEDARLAYIQATQGRRAMREAYKAMQDATEGRDPAHRELKRRFIDAWEHAHADWLERRKRILLAELLPGRVIEALRTGMGLSVEEWAADLNVSISTARDWETDRRPAPEGACADMWEMWTAWLSRQAVAVGVPGDLITENATQLPIIVPATTSVHDIRARLILLAGQRVTIDPGPEIQHDFSAEPGYN